MRDLIDHALYIAIGATGFALIACVALFLYATWTANVGHWRKS